MLLSEVQERSLELAEFDRKKAITSLDAGKPVIPVWLDEIYQRLALKMKSRNIRNEQ